MKITCESPNIILNPNIGELLFRFPDYHLNGVDYHDGRRLSNLYSTRKSRFNLLIVKNIINKDNYESNYILDKATGCTYPIYICVPCGHCTLCKEKKVNSFVKRILYESFCYNYKPLFVTLTYNDKSLPSDGVSLRDCQLFLKRLRVNLHRGGYVQHIRYVLVSEYGKRTHRAHYHAILFGLPVVDDRDMRRFEDILNKSWPLGFTMARQIDMSDIRTAYYTTKYLRKDCAVPDGCNKTFACSSRRGGGIGTPFLKRESAVLRKRVCTDAKVLNTWTGRTEPLVWSKFVLDKIYPSLATFIPLELRKSVKRFVRNYNYLKNTNQDDVWWLFEDTFLHARDKYKGLIYCDWDNDKGFDSTINDAAVGDIYEDEKIIDKYRHDDFSDAYAIATNRDLLVYNLSLKQIGDVDLVQKVARIKRRNKHLEQFEVL